MAFYREVGSPLACFSNRSNPVFTPGNQTSLNEKRVEKPENNKNQVITHPSSCASCLVGRAIPTLPFAPAPCLFNSVNRLIARLFP